MNVEETITTLGFLAAFALAFIIYLIAAGKEKD